MTSAELKNPFVLQCKTCLAILADSFSLQNYNEKYIVFKNSSSLLKIQPQKHISTKNFDKDCQYSYLQCQCNKIVGKLYFTVNKDCHTYLNNFCFENECVVSYMLGVDVSPSLKNLSDVAEDIDKLKRFCEYLYRKTNQ
ncbi:hypothetical protein EDEG_00587 [Edhazardia aedis USNM 41457]|uniref:Protein yippee-like n=1 Tax=Edhazardia aedis (strain USNM 41457) TaxID=1003232 RepID=J9DC88_EDHAE|nr:hypothetical protein EDEG_00587 [Edhazardia aedis USNM 41457]|eukprot:EJW05361.1 hypothetical protein EDEG_00587 [Edhazardia aedis USNM 41457]